MNSRPRETFVFEELGLVDAARLHDIYEVYKTSFPHPDEQEPFHAFVKILALNSDQAIQHQFGPYREIVLAISPRSTGQIVGGLVIGVTSGPEHLTAGFAASVQAIYLFVYRDWRKYLVPRDVINEIHRHALMAFPPPPDFAGNDIAIFFEANNPVRMSPEEIAEDFDNSETDPFRRYMSWRERGDPLNFRYVQPALDASKSPVHFLDLFYMGRGTDVPAAMLLKHLYRFVSVSVLKGRDAEQNPDYRAMADELRQMTRVTFIPRNDPDQLSILHQRDARLFETRQARARTITMLAPPLPRGRRRSFFLRPRLGNTLYRGCYRLYHFLERYHIAVAYLEAGLGVIAFIGALSVIIGNWTDLKGLTFVTQVINLATNAGEWMQFERHERQVTAFIWLFLSVYILSRGFVRTRRGHLGYRFGALQREVARLDPGDAAGVDRVTIWLRDELSRRAAGRDAFGPMISDTTQPAERSRVQVLIASLSAQIYSDQVWGVVDRDWQAWETSRLADWLGQFPDGLQGATYQSCPGRTFFSLVIPVIAPATRLTRLDLRQLAIDTRVARRLRTHMAGPPIRTDTTSGPPTLIVLRLLVSGQTEKTRSTPKERQFGLVLTGLLHLALLLRQLASNGDLVNGLPANTTLLVVAASAQSVRILQLFGFSLLQRAAAHDAEDSEEEPGEANLGVYRLIIGSSTERSPEEHRFLAILTELLKTLPST